jgi:hypothetical protein
MNETLNQGRDVSLDHLLVREERGRTLGEGAR